MNDDVQRVALERAVGAQYQVLRLLGRGGMGAVYLGLERALERKVAIKVLPSELASDADSRERFRREARTAAALSHPNIVPLHTFGEAEGMQFFVMGYVQGESLGARLQREPTLPPDDVRQILGEIADALDYAHRHGVVHRDIKPDNVLLDADSGRPMLTDFGVAKARASGATLTEVGAIVGTPHYMSPEQASGQRDLDGRSDLYSLGVMGYRMLAGRLPFDGDSLRDVVVKHVTQAPPPLETVAPQVPSDLSIAVTRCLAKDPAQRFADGRSLRLAIEGAGDELLSLPVELRYVAKFGYWRMTKEMFVVASMGVLAFATRNTNYWSIFVTVMALYFVVDWIPFIAYQRIARRKGHSPSVIAEYRQRTPSGWRFWWPQKWRRAGDVWDRLPPSIRWARITWTIDIVAGVAVTWLLVAAYGVTREDRVVFLIIALGMIAAAVVLLFHGAAGVHKWRKHRGLSGDLMQGLLTHQTYDPPFWRQQSLASALEPASSQKSPGNDPQSAAEYARAIGDAAALITGPTRGVASEGVSAANHLAALVAALDKELAQLARDANPAELDQVRQKLAALGNVAGDNESRQKMRTLLLGQEELLRDLATRFQHVTNRRAHMIDLLRTLWLQVAQLRATVAAEALDEKATTGRIRAIVDEIRRHSDAIATVNVLVENT